SDRVSRVVGAVDQPGREAGDRGRWVGADVSIHDARTSVRDRRAREDRKGPRGAEPDRGGTRGAGEARRQRDRECESCAAGKHASVGTELLLHAQRPTVVLRVVVAVAERVSPKASEASLTMSQAT